MRSFLLVIQHLILEGRTTDAIEKTKELFPTLLNNKNLLFILKVRQFIEMINGTESEISPSSKSSTLKLSNSSSSNKKSSSTTNKRSLSPLNKSNTSSRSRSKSPYTSGRNQTMQQNSNGTTNSSSRRSSVNNNELPQGKFISTVS
jgi:hypothetical protein